jgi:hypothetical protein
MSGMTDEEVEAFMANLPTIIAIHEKVQKVLHLFRNREATVAELQRTLLEVVRVVSSLRHFLFSEHVFDPHSLPAVSFLSCPILTHVQEYTRRKLALEKSLQYGVRSRHLALNDKYLELMDYVGCPWIQSVLPVSLACDDLSLWIARMRYSMPKIKVPARLRELAGLPPDPDDVQLGADIQDSRPIVEPQELKRRSISASEASPPRLTASSVAGTAWRTVQMSIIMGFKVCIFVCILLLLHVVT